MKKLSAMMLVTAVAITGIAGTVMSTKGITAQAATNEISTPNGIADFQEGTTNITIWGQNETMLGKKFRVHRLFNAKISEAGESINYTFVPEYEDAIKEAVSKTSGIGVSDLTEYKVIDYIQTLNNYPSDNAFYGQDEEGRYSDYRYLVEVLRDAIGDAGIQGTIVNVTDTGEDYEIVLSNLSAGYYIIDEITAVEGTHSAAALCMANTSTNSYINIKSDYPNIVKKIQEDDGEIGWNDIGDFEIGQTVPYRFESTIPNINGYQSYYYAWHDVMDEALTFNPGSVKITIYGLEELQLRSANSYTLDASEFEVKTNLDNGETFVVEIQDIKDIIDREFDEINEEGHNRYNQTVVLEYNATLNDKAAEDTGRPGFENDVKLEFSNDPDSNGTGKTGETPWDTTVCFTYRLDVQKTNSHDLALEGAKFRLYSDEDCQNEVFVKQTSNGYNVINRDSVGGTDHTGGTAPVDAVEMISKADGTFVIYGLDSGVYYLKETKAPTGYRQLLDPIVLTVDATFTEERNSYVKGTGSTDDVLQALTVTAYIKEFLNGVYVENTIDLTTDLELGNMNLTVINTEGKKLPATGSAMTLVCVGVGTALVVYGASRKRKDKACES